MNTTCAGCGDEVSPPCLTFYNGYTGRKSPFHGMGCLRAWGEKDHAQAMADAMRVNAPGVRINYMKFV